MIAAVIWSYIAGMVAVWSLIVFEIVDEGDTKWQWYTPILWPLLLPAAVFVLVSGRRKEREEG